MKQVLNVAEAAEAVIAIAAAMSELGNDAVIIFVANIRDHISILVDAQVGSAGHRFGLPMPVLLDAIKPAEVS